MIVPVVLMLHVPVYLREVRLAFACQDADLVDQARYTSCCIRSTRESKDEYLIARSPVRRQKLIAFPDNLRDAIAGESLESAQQAGPAAYPMMVVDDLGHALVAHGLNASCYSCNVARNLKGAFEVAVVGVEPCPVFAEDDAFVGLGPGTFGAGSTAAGVGSARLWCW